MDRQLSSTRLCIFTALLAVVLVVSGSGIAAVLPSGPAGVSVDGGSAGVGVVSAQTTNGTDSGANETRSADEPINETDIDPRFQNVTVPVEDAEPSTSGTTVFVREETVLSMTFAAQADEIAGSVSVSKSDSPAVEDLSRSRIVHRAVDITVPEAATETPATLQLVVEALPVADRENLEVMRYNESGETWEPLNTTVVSNRTWSADRGASVLLLEAETPGFSTFAVTETGTGGGSTTDGDSGEVNETGPEDNERAGISPHPDATTVWINDRRPYEYGTTVLIHEETVRAITFAADKESIRGIVAVNDSNLSAVSELRTQRSVIRTVDITATEPANRTPATLHLMVRALAVDDRNDIEVMRYDDTAGSWEALPTETVGERTWSGDLQASVYRVDAETSGFSTFAVTEAPEPEPQPDSEPESEPEPQPTDDTSDSESQNDGIIFGIGLFEIAIALLVVAGGAGAVFVVRRR